MTGHKFSWRKGVLLALGALALLLLGAALALRLLVDPERLKKLASDRARDAWERELLLGDVRLDLLPTPAFRASGLSFSNPAWANEPHLVKADSVRAELELLPLLAGKVRIKRLSLEGVKAGLEVADDGAVSWELSPPARKDVVDAADRDADDPLQIESVHIRNARVVHRRQKSASEPWLIEEALVQSGASRKDVRVEARLLRHDQPMQVKARFADLSQAGREGAASEGAVQLEWKGARAEASGRFALHKALAGQDAVFTVKAESLDAMLAFLGLRRGSTAPLEMKARVQEAGGVLQVSELAASLGPLQVSGDARIKWGEKPTVEARLQAGRIDWLRTLRDAGGTLRPPRNDGQVFHEDPVAWRAVKALGSIDGTAQLKVGAFKMGNGLELRNVQTTVSLGGGRIELKPFLAEIAGGPTRGAMRLDSARKAIRFELDGDNVSLDRWFEERGSKVPFSGGPMRLRARLDLTGDTYRELAASTTGTFALRMGQGRWDSRRAGEMEEMFVRVLQPKDGGDIEFQCAAANLHFKSGIARGKEIVGARSDVSQLLTSGTVDLRSETIDLRGKVISRSGTRVGVGLLASDVQVSGRLSKPRMQLDPDARAAVLARAGAAIATAGASLLGSALVDVVESQSNPCDRVSGRTARDGP